MRRKAILILLFFVIFNRAQAFETDLLITEIMYDAPGADSGHEWVEIFNSGVEELTPSSTWRFFDGSNHILNLEQATTTIPSQGFFILADNKENFLLDYPDFIGLVIDTVMSLPNSSSTVALSFDEGAVYPVEVIYNNAWGGVDGLGLQWVNDNWVEGCDIGGSPGIENGECPIEEDPPENDEPPVEENPEPNPDWLNILISEFLPNPAGSDDNEWIELFNNAEVPLALNGFVLGDNSSRRFIIADTDEGDLFLAGKSYLLLPKSQTGISLNNSGSEVVKLYNPLGELQEEVEYSGAVLEGRSYARSDSGFVWTKSPTPGSVNVIVANQAPIAQISAEGDFYINEKINFSGVNSSDPEGDDLDYYWEFGDGDTSSKVTIKHKFDQVGHYTVRLTVTDPEDATDQAEFIIDIYSESEDLVEEDDDKDAETVEAEEVQPIEIDFSEDDLIISEILPNPKGSDDNEWIELYNASSKKIDLLGWSIDDQEGGSKPYQFASTTIAANDFLLVKRADSKLSLNNSGDEVRLIKPDGDIWQQVVYEKIPEGQTWAWDFENLEWTIMDKSPEAANIKIIEPEIIYLVSELSNMSKGDEVLVQGVVINSPDKDSRSIYLADFDGSYINFDNLVEIYSYYKDFPEIKSGEVVTVEGEVSRVGALPRVKIKKAEQVWSTEQVVEFGELDIFSPDDLDEDFVGSYLSVKGMVVKKSGKSIYLASDEEEEYNVRVYTKFSTKELEIKKGSEVIATGILSETDSSLKLEPFSVNDISVSKEVLGEKIEAQEHNTDIVSTTNQVVEIPQKNQGKNIIIFVVVAVILATIVYFFKKRKSQESFDKI